MPYIKFNILAFLIDESSCTTFYDYFVLYIHLSLEVTLLPLLDNHMLSGDSLFFVVLTEIPYSCIQF